MWYNNFQRSTLDDYHYMLISAVLFVRYMWWPWHWHTTVTNSEYFQLSDCMLNYTWITTEKLAWDWSSLRGLVAALFAISKLLVLKLFCGIHFRSFQLLLFFKQHIHNSILMGNLAAFIVLFCLLVETNCGKWFVLLIFSNLNRQKSFSSRQQESL